MLEPWIAKGCRVYEYMFVFARGLRVRTPDLSFFEVYGINVSSYSWAAESPLYSQTHRLAKYAGRPTSKLTSPGSTLVCALNLIVPRKYIEYGVYGHLTVIYPKPYSIYLGFYKPASFLVHPGLPAHLTTLVSAC